MNRSRAAALHLALLAACGGGSDRHPIVRVTPPGGGCLPPADARTLVVYALGDFPPAAAPAASGAIDEPLAIDTFPGDTRELALELLASGSVVRAVGRSGPLDLSALGDGAPVPILVAPPRSFCRVGSLITARTRPIAARAGAGVLIAGGESASSGGDPIATAELYDPATGSFRELTSRPHFDLRGGRAVTLPGGDVFLVWGEGYQIYDAGAETFGVATLPPAGVVFHADPQVALLPDGKVLVAGGCADPAGRAHAGCAAAFDAQVFDPATGAFAPAPALVVARAGGSAAVEGDGAVWLAGGVDGVMLPGAERRDAAGAGQAFAAPGGVAAPLPAGGFLAAYAPEGAAPAGQGVAMPSGGGSGVAVTAGAMRAGPTLTLLEDGAVLVVGGGAAGAELYRPHAARFDSLAGATPPASSGQAAVLLGDGSVLIAGGAAGAAALDDAWIYRHDLTGPFANLPAQVFVGPDSAPLVVPGDPDPMITHQEADPPRLVLDRGNAIAGLTAWALVAGPRFVDVDLLAVVAADGAPLRLLLGADGPLAGIHVTLAEDAPVTAARVGAVASAALCAGQTVLPDAALSEATGPHDVHAVLRAGTLTVTVDETEYLRCDVPATPRGSVGVAIGDGPTARLSVYAIVLQR